MAIIDIAYFSSIPEIFNNIEINVILTSTKEGR